MVFIEYNYEEAPIERTHRFWIAFHAANPNSGAAYPMVMIDSGQQVKSGGSATPRTMYGEMVEKALARPAQVALEASWWRVDDAVAGSVRVTNLAGQPLGETDKATVHMIVFEHKKVQLTGSFVRKVVSAQLPLLAPGESTQVMLKTNGLGVDWSKVGVLFIVDRQVGGWNDPYDALQAALASEVQAPLAVGPERLTALADPAGALPLTQTISIQGAAGMTWWAEVDVPWLTVTPISGTIGTASQITLVPAALQPGWQQGTVRYRLDGQGIYTDSLAIDAYAGEVSRVLLPAVQK